MFHATCVVMFRLLSLLTITMSCSLQSLNHDLHCPRLDVREERLAVFIPDFVVFQGVDALVPRAPRLDLRGRR